MAGYNTVSEVVRARTPMLLLPRTGPSREQLVRATALAADGTAAMLPLDGATPARLSAELTRLIDGPAPAFDPAAHDGAGRAATILCELATAADPKAEPLLALAW
jgi:predicted glycosyltransferase